MLAGEILVLAFENASTMQQMRQEEQRLLKFRMGASNHLYRLTVIILFASFALALILLLFTISFSPTNLKRAPRQRAPLEKAKIPFVNLPLVCCRCRMRSAESFPVSFMTALASISLA